jgi:hypothetical protein
MVAAPGPARVPQLSWERTFAAVRLALRLVRAGSKGLEHRSVGQPAELSSSMNVGSIQLRAACRGRSSQKRFSGPRQRHTLGKRAEQIQLYDVSSTDGIVG